LSRLFRERIHPRCIAQKHCVKKRHRGSDDLGGQLKAAEFFAKAESETDPEMRAGFENLARAYLRLAEQALRNAQTDVIYEPAPPKLDDPELKR
jgi:hypothetical protein